jgi:hypothetical protein
MNLYSRLCKQRDQTIQVWFGATNIGEKLFPWKFLGRGIFLELSGDFTDSVSAQISIAGNHIMARQMFSSRMQ